MTVPQRSNLHQAVVYYIKKHLAPPDAEVTESKMLVDLDSGEEREVDVVVEGRVGDDPVVVSVEVQARQRRAGSPWVDEMITKHSRMPTNRLVLVSWSGFTGPARRKVDRQGGRVVALTPDVEPNATVPLLFYQELTTRPERASLLIENGGERSWVSEVPINANLYGEPEHEAFLCTLVDLVNRFLNARGGKELTQQAYDHPDRDSLTHFSLEQTDLAALGVDLYAHRGDTDEFDKVIGFSVSGPITLRYQPVNFRPMRLGDTLFAMTEVQMGGRDAVWVLTPNDDRSATVSWRLI
jgi:hypothetical protein